MVEFVRKIRSTIEDKHLLLRPEIDLLIYEHLIYEKDGTEKQEEKMFFSIYVVGTTDYHVGKKEMIPTLLHTQIWIPSGKTKCLLELCCPM